MYQIHGLLNRTLVIWERPVWSLFLAFSIYLVFAIHFTAFPLRVSKVAYYNYLADAVLHGQLSLRIVPPVTHDLVLFEGKYFLYWPPLPAFIMAPFVALFGIEFSDVVFNLAIASLNVCMVCILLRTASELDLIDLTSEQRALMVLFFALGTVHAPLAPYGRVWSTGQLLGFLMLSVTYLSSLKLKGTKAFAFTGIGLAATLLTRNHMVFAGIWPVVYLLRENTIAKRSRLTLGIAVLGIPIIIGLAAVAAYNWFRFGAVLDNGLNYHLLATSFEHDFQRYGLFSLHYLPTNLFYQYLAYPFPITARTFYGGSLFLLSPVFFALFWGIARSAARWSVWALVASIVIVQIPIVTLMGTGWVQFGPRYSLDFILPLLMLTGMGVQYWHRWVLAVLTAVSCLQYLFGTMYFGGYLGLLKNI
jgi:hypothetical protein